MVYLGLSWIITGDPSMIFCHSLIVAQWIPDFASPKARVGSAMVRLPGLSHPYQYERFLMGMDSDIGQPIKTDHK